MRNMKRLFILISLIAISFTLIAQPILPTLRFTTNVYNPKLPEKPIIGPRGPRGYKGEQGMQGIPGVPGEDAIIPLKANIATVPAPNLKDTVTNNYYFINVTNPTKIVYALDPTPLPKLFMKKGTGKILTGLGLQTIAIGMVAYASIPKYNFKTVETVTPVKYKYNVYELEKDKGKHHKPHHYSLHMFVKTGQIEVKDVDQVTEVRHTNNNAYYIGAGILSVVGVALEVSGIIDLHNTQVYLSQNSIGFIKTF